MKLNEKLSGKACRVYDIEPPAGSEFLNTILSDKVLARALEETAENNPDIPFSRWQEIEAFATPAAGLEFLSSARVKPVADISSAREELRRTYRSAIDGLHENDPRRKLYNTHLLYIDRYPA